MKGNEQLMEVLDTQTGKLVGERKLPVERRNLKATTYVHRIRSAIMSPDGRRVVYLMGEEWQVESKIWGIHFGERKVGLVPPFDRDAHLWDVQTGGETLLKGHTNDIATTSFSRDSRFVITASVDGTARMWDLGPDVVMVLRGEGTGIGLAHFSPDGRHLVTARGRVESDPEWDEKERQKPHLHQSAHLWDAALGKETSVLRGLATEGDAGWRDRLLGAIAVVKFSPNSDRMLTVSRDVYGRMQKAGGKEEPIPYTPVRVWDAASGKELLALKGLTEPIQTASFSPDGRTLLTVSSGMGSETVLTPNGASGEDGFRWGARDRIRLYDAGTGELLRTIGRPNVFFADAVWSPESRRIYVFDSQGSQIWDAESGQEIAKLEGDGASAGVVSPDGKLVLGYVNVFQPNREMARIWDAASGKKLVTLMGHAEEIYAAAFNHDGTRVVTASRDGTARLWNSATGKELAVLRGHEAPIHAAAFSPDGRWVVTGGDDNAAPYLGRGHRQGMADVGRPRRPRNLGRIQPRRPTHRDGFARRHRSPVARGPAASRQGTSPERVDGGGEAPL